MKDGYSFDNNINDSYNTYLNLYNCYVNIFKDLGIGDNCVVASGDSGPIGGKLNHEIVFLDEDGDTTVWYQEHGLKFFNSLEELNDNGGTVETYLKNPEKNYHEARGIELGHLFNYGDKYSEAMDVTFINSEGKKEYIYGGCYGIGVTRLIAAIVQKYNDENGIKWPSSISPFKFYIIYNDQKFYDARKIYDELGEDICLLDDRSESLGVKLKDGDLLGISYQIILANNYQIKNRWTDEVINFNCLKDLSDYAMKI
jgi:prolyl-tRNA synthetase